MIPGPSLTEIEENPMADNTALQRLLLSAEITEFFSNEADLLDNRRYDEWLALLEERIAYRMPLARNVRRDDAAREFTGEDDIAWFDEGISTLRQRVAQIRTGVHWAEEPPSRVSHLFTNIRLIDVQPSLDAPSEVTVSSRFLVYQNRLQTEVNLFIGKRVDVLTRHEDGWKVLKRTIYLDQSVLQAKALTVFF